MKELLKLKNDELLSNPALLRGLKYSIIVVAEAIVATLQHILAKQHKLVVDSSIDAITKSVRVNLIPESVAVRLQGFIRFRTMLVHSYWKADDQLFLANLRRGSKISKNL